MREIKKEVKWGSEWRDWITKKYRKIRENKIR